MISQKKWYKNLDSSVPPNLSAWLLHEGSFMERLKNHGIFGAKITIINESWQLPFDDEKEILPIESEALVREVWITSENKCWMLARSVIPSGFLKGKFKALQDLNTRPIGTILFQDKNIVRSEFEFRLIDHTFDLYHQLKNNMQNTKMYARRSLFSIEKDALLLTEVFMPDMMTL